MVHSIDLRVQQKYNLGSSKHFSLNFDLYESICLNICYRCSKKLSYWGGTFENPQRMFVLRNNKIISLITHS